MTPEELEKRAQAYESEGLEVERLETFGKGLQRIRVMKPRPGLVDIAIEDELLGGP